MKATKERFILWGWRRDDAYSTLPIALHGGTLRQCQAEQRQRERKSHHPGWVLAIYAQGTPPTGLRLQVEEIRNGVRREA